MHHARACRSRTGGRAARGRPAARDGSVAVLGEALDGRHLVPVGLDGEQRARLDRLAVEQHRAGAARRRVAADVRARSGRAARAGSRRAAGAARPRPRGARR